MELLSTPRPPPRGGRPPRGSRPPAEPDHLESRRALGIAFGFALALAWLPLRAAAQAAATDELHEYEVKAAFVFKFGEFVDWPAHAFADPAAPFTIAVIGADAIAEVLDQLAKQRPIKDRRVVVHRLHRGEPIAPAQIVFIGAGDADRLRAVADSIKSAGALTVTETTRPSQPSGVINFVIRDNRVRFEIDADAAEQAGLRISSKLLSLAVFVKGRQK